MEPFRFSAWAEAYSQKTNRSLAGTRLYIGHDGGASCGIDQADLAQAQDWGMVPSRDSAEMQTGHAIDATMPLGDVVDARELTGAEAMRFAQEHMLVLDALMRQMRKDVDFTGIRIAVCLILEPKTAVLLRQLKAAGAIVGAYCGYEANDERVAVQLRTEGIPVAYDPDWTPAQAHQGALDLLDEIQPNIIIDDGASFARLAAMERPELMGHIIGVAEETTSGIRAFQAMQDAGALTFPVIAVNDSMLKTGFDNAHGTGETCITTLQRILGSDCFAGSNVSVVGYGPVGRGFAHRVRALGANVTICDTDPVVALQAVFDGFHAENKRELRDLAVPDGPVIRLISEGDGVNYTVGGGNPIEIMDLSFAVQASAVAHLLRHRGTLQPGLQRLGRDIDRHIADIALRTRGYRASHAVADNGYDWTLTRFAENEKE